MGKIRADEAKPGQMVHVMGGKYWIRYIWYYGERLAFGLQPHDEPLSPFYENDVITVYIGTDVLIEVE